METKINKETNIKIPENQNIKIIKKEEKTIIKEIEDFLIKNNKEKREEFENISEDKKQKIIEILNESPFLKNKLEFSFNYKHNIQIVKIVDRETNNTIREFPTKEFFKNLSYFKENILKGLLFNQKI